LKSAYGAVSKESPESARYLIAAATLWLSMSASAQIQFSSQSRTVSAQSVAMPLVTKSASNLGQFTEGVSSVGTPEAGSNGSASASQDSRPGSFQVFGSGYASRGKSTAMNSGYGTASSSHSMSFSVPVNTPFNFSTKFNYAQVNLTGPGVSMVHGYIDTTSENGVFLAGQTYTVYAFTMGDVQVGNAIPGDFAFAITLNGIPPIPTAVQAAPSATGLCPGDHVVLSAAAPPAGQVTDWYGNAGELVGTGNSIEVVKSSNNSDYFSARTRRVEDGAVSFTSTDITLRLKTVIFPTTITANRNNLCQYDGGTIQLSASGGQGTGYEWFADSCGGTPIGASGTIVIPAPHVTTTYYVRRVNLCVVSTCRPVTVTVRSCPGDFDCSGAVDDSDFIPFATAYDILSCSDPAMPSGCPADLNGDGLVDDADFVQFAQGYEVLTCP